MKEIRIRRVTPFEHKRIALTAREKDMRIDDFCLEAALIACAKRDQEREAERTQKGK